MTVHTDPALPQCAAVRTQVGEMRMPPQTDEPLIIMATRNGNSQGGAG